MAALLVVFFHLAVVAGGGSGVTRPVEIWGKPAREVFGWFYVPASYGWLGVQLFFMISGFVICMSSWGRTPAQFVVSRIVRLFPAYWVCVALTSTFVFLYPAVFRPLRPTDILTNLTMVQSQVATPNVDDVYWTLAAEMKFYLLFTVVTWFGVNYRRVVLFCLLWSAGSLVATETNTTLLKTVLLPTYSPYFIAGVAFYLMYRFGPNLVLWGIVGFSWIIAVRYHAAHLWQSWVGLPYWPAAVFITGCFVLLTLLALGKLQWLRWRFLSSLGATTYPLYLLHYVIGTSLVYFLTQHTSIAPAVLLPVVVVGFVMLAWLVHRLVERPFAPMLKRALIRGVDRIRVQSGPATTYRPQHHVRQRRETELKPLDQ